MTTEDLVSLKSLASAQERLSYTTHRKWHLQYDDDATEQLKTTWVPLITYRWAWSTRRPLGEKTKGKKTQKSKKSKSSVRDTIHPQAGDTNWECDWKRLLWKDVWIILTSSPSAPKVHTATSKVTKTSWIKGKAGENKNILAISTFFGCNQGFFLWKGNICVPLWRSCLITQYLLYRRSISKHNAGAHLWNNKAASSDDYWARGLLSGEATMKKWKRKLICVNKCTDSFTFVW